MNVQTPFNLTGLYGTRWGMMVGLTCDPYQSGSLSMYGEWAKDECDTICSLLNPGDIAIDVGANIGTLAVAMAKKVGMNGLIYAFEPQRYAYACLCANTALTHTLLQTRCLNAAVSDFDGSIMVPVPDITKAFNVGGVRLQDALYDAAVPMPKEEVPCFTIDSLGLDRVNLIKIDVETMESKVLTGAEKTIQRTRPVIFAEAMLDSGSDLEKANIAKVFDLLKVWNYEARMLITPLFSAHNIRHCPDNIFPGGDCNIVGIPNELTKPDWFKSLPLTRPGL